MKVVRAAKWIGGLVACGSLLLMLSIFVADRRLAPPFDEATLEPIEIPVGEPLGTDLLFFSSDRSGNFELYTQNLDGGPPQQLTIDPDFDSWRPRLSPDRTTVLFYRTPVGVADSDSSASALWMMSPEGTLLVEVLPARSHGWTSQGHAEWSPTGDELVMMGERPQGQQIWITSVDGRLVRPLVNDPGDNTDPTWDPEGIRVLYSACPQSPCGDAEREIFEIQSAGGDREQITNDDIHDTQPRFSPDGSQIAVRSEMIAGDEDGNGAVWDIRVLPSNRTTPAERLVGDDSVSGSPIWLDNQTVLFHRIDGEGVGNIVSIRIGSFAESVLVAGSSLDLYPAP